MTIPAVLQGSEDINQPGEVGPEPKQQLPHLRMLIDAIWERVVPSDFEIDRL